MEAYFIIIKEDRKGRQLSNAFSITILTSNKN